MAGGKLFRTKKNAIDRLTSVLGVYGYIESMWMTWVTFHYDAELM